MFKMPKPTLTYISTFWILLILSPFLSFAAEPEAPEITSGPDLFVLTNKAAIINWETDENSDSTIQYDLESRAWGEFTYETNDTQLVTKHSLKITGLIPDTQYYFRVGSVDVAGNGPDLNSNSTNPSEEQSFITNAVSDTTAPRISNIRILDFTDDTTTFQYTTDEPGTTIAQYGTTMSEWNGYDTRINDEELVTQHIFTMQIEWGIVYYFRMASTDYSGNGPSASSTDENPTEEWTLTSRGDPPTDDGNTPNSGDNNPGEPPEATCFIDSLLPSGSSVQFFLYSESQFF